MQKNYASAVFDRKKQLKTKGVGKVEILICLSHSVKKYIGIKTCTEKEWKFYQTSIELEDCSKVKMVNCTFVNCK